MSVKQILAMILGLGFLHSLGSGAAVGRETYASRQARPYNGPYQNEYLAQIAFPMGGVGAGMFCLEGNGCLSHVSIRHQPEIFNEPQTFASVYVKTAAREVARVLEGPVPGHKILLPRGGSWNSSGNGAGGTTYGLPRFRKAEFLARFPFATLKLTDSAVPLLVELTGWSPFTPPHADDSSLPVAALEYRFTNTGDRTLEGVFSFHSENFVDIEGDSSSEVRAIPGGFLLGQPAVEKEPWQEGAFCVSCDDPGAKVDCAWFRGGWFDALTMLWKAVSSGDVVSRGPHRDGATSKGASLYVPFELGGGQSRTIRLRLAWYVPRSNIRTGQHAPASSKKSRPTHYTPWYARRFANVGEVVEYWRKNYERLRRASAAFRDCFFDLSQHANPQRPTYALNNEAGLVLCSWPKGDELSLPFVYSNEVWTGIEYQVASHLMLMGRVGEGLDIVRACRDRYDGRVRNPFSEIECGHFYARALASYGLLQAMSGARYDAVEKTLYLSPPVEGNFRAFLCTAKGYGTVGIRDGKPFVEVKSGTIDVQQIRPR